MFDILGVVLAQRQVGGGGASFVLSMLAEPHRPHHPPRFLLQSLTSWNELGVARIALCAVAKKKCSLPHLHRNSVTAWRMAWRCISLSDLLTH